jgi:hypothetical protein
MKKYTLIKNHKFTMLWTTIETRNAILRRENCFVITQNWITKLNSKDLENLKCDIEAMFFNNYVIYWVWDTIILKRKINWELLDIAIVVKEQFIEILLSN